MLSRPAAGSWLLLLVAVVAFLSFCPTTTSGLVIRLPSGSEYCFFEEATKADKIVGNYRVLEGGELDIDLKITDPRGKTVFETIQKREESFQFFALADGDYTLCLSNKFSLVTGKTVVFNLHLGASLQKKDAAKASHFTPLESGVMKLGQNIREVADWTAHIKTRERIHHNSQTKGTTRRKRLFAGGRAALDDL